MIPYGKHSIDDDDIASVVSVLKSDWLTQGPWVPRFEDALASFCHVQYGVAVNSATSALHIACLALGVGDKDLVWTSPNSFVASANCARFCGADIDFVDIEQDTGNMCMDALQDKLETACAAKQLPKVVIPVHFSGQPCNMKRLHNLAEKYGFSIIEDASHAVGARYNDKMIGSCQYSDICVFSFHPVKIITSLEGGMAMTNSVELARSMRLARSHGVTSQKELMDREADGAWYYQQLSLGFNYRMNDVEAAIGLSQLGKLPRFIRERNTVACLYDAHFKGVCSVKPLVVAEGCDSSYHLYVVRITGLTLALKSKLVEEMRAQGVYVHVHYIPIHTQPYYRRLGFSHGDFPNAECYYHHALTLPIFPSMTNYEVEHVVTTLLRTMSRLGV